MADTRAEALRIDRRGLFSENFRRLAFDLDFWSKARVSR
jgi:hypothetical protein